MKTKVALHVLSCFSEGYDIITIDESGFNSILFFTRGWEIKGKTLLIGAENTNCPNHSLLMAVSLKYGIIAY